MGWIVEQIIKFFLTCLGLCQRAEEPAKKADVAIKAGTINLVEFTKDKSKQLTSSTHQLVLTAKEEGKRIYREKKTPINQATSTPASKFYGDLWEDM